MDNIEVQSVINEEPIKAKPPLHRRILKTLTGDETWGDFGRRIWNGIVEKAIRNIIHDIYSMITNALSEAILGRSAYPSNVVSYSSGQRYKPNYTQYNKQPQRAAEFVTRSSVHIEEYVLQSRASCIDVLAHMQEILGRHGSVTVADYYNLMGVKTSMTDRDFGWVDLSRAKVLPRQDGYLLDLPKPIQL